MSKQRWEYVYTGRREVLDLFGVRFVRGVPVVRAHPFSQAEGLDLERYGVLLVRTFQVGPGSEDATTEASPAPVVAPEAVADPGAVKTTIRITKGRPGGVRRS